MAQMWFGNEQHFQWVPMPSTGMQVSHVGYGQELQYQNGRKGVVRSMQTHKEYAMNFPVQEASGLQGLDVFQKYASGFYGDLDSNPLFLADCMNYDQNLLPPNWASPGLYRRGWAALVEDNARAYDNLHSNPSVEVSATGYSPIPGTSGTANGARVASGTTVAAYVGNYFYEVTWSVATTAISGGVSAGTASAQAGSPHGVMVHVNCSKTQRLRVNMVFLDAGASVLGTVPSSDVVVSAGVWTEITVPVSTAPAGTVNVRVDVIAVAGTSGSNWAVGDKLRIDGVMVYSVFGATAAPPPYYFDGNSTNASWTGAVGLSRSRLFVPRVTPTISSTPANSYNLPALRATWPITSAVNAAPSLNNNVPYALIPIPPGMTLHIGYAGLVTGSGQLVVESFNSPATSTGVTVLSPLTSAGAQRMNASIASTTAEYVKVYIRRTTTADSSITISSIMAQLWPTGVTPNLNGNHIEGKGHRGLKFTDTPTVESYELVDMYRTPNVAHYKGMSTSLIEAQDRG